MILDSNIFQLKKEINSLAQIGFWDKLSSSQIKIWLKQFNNPEYALLGHLILKNLIYRNDKQMTQLLCQALRRAVSHFVEEDDRDRFSCQQILQEDYNGKKIYCGPLNFNKEGFGKPGKSGEIIMSMIRSYVPKSRFYYPDYFDSGLKADEGFFLIDDAILTGHQMEEWINRYYQQLMLDKSSTSALVVGLAHEDALQYLKETLPNLRIFYGEIILSNSSLTELCQNWVDKKIWPDDFRPPLEVFNEISINANFQQPQHLGHLNQALLLAYSYSTPDNSIQILRDISDNWTPLVSR